MAFNDGIDEIKDYLDKRSDQIKDGEKLEWAKDFNELIDKFKRDDEHGEYTQLVSSIEQADVRKIRAVRTKIAWLCACARDLHIQFANAKNEERTHITPYQHQAIRMKFLAITTLEHAKEFLKVE